MINKISLLLVILILTMSCQKQKKDKYLKGNNGGLIISQYSLIDSLNSLSKEAREYYRLANEHLKNKDYESALNEVKKTMAIEVTPHVLNQAGLAFMGINKDSAITYFKKSIMSDSQFYYPYNNLSMVYRTKGQFERSISILNLGIKKAAESEDLWGLYLNRGITKTFNNQIQSARADFDSARLLCPNPQLLKKFEDFYNYRSGKDELKKLLEVN